MGALLGNIYGTGSNYSYRGGTNYSGMTNSTTATRYKTRTVTQDVAANYGQDLSDLEYYMSIGDTDSAVGLYNELSNDISADIDENYNLNMNDRNKNNRQKEAFEMVNNKTIQQAVRENTHGSFVTGFLEGLDPLGLFTNENSEAETMAKLSNTKVRFREQAKEGIGTAVGGAALGAVAAPVLGAIFGASGVGAGVGGALAAVGIGATLTPAILPLMAAGAVVGLIALGVKSFIAES